MLTIQTVTCFKQKQTCRFQTCYPESAKRSLSLLIQIRFGEIIDFPITLSISPSGAIVLRIARAPPLDHSLAFHPTDGRGRRYRDRLIHGPQVVRML